MTRWCDLSPEVWSVAYHEAGHGVVAEALGWRVKNLQVEDDGDGVCLFLAASPVPWVDFVVSGAGHAAEMYYRGRVFGIGSYPDRRDAADVVESARVAEWHSPSAAWDVEESLWPVFTDTTVSVAVRRVARTLGRRGHLTRREFLELADPCLDPGTCRRVRRFCRRLALGIHSKYLEERG